MSASTQCPHSDLHIDIHNQGFVDSNLHYLEIKMRCKTCDKPMVFRGCPLGLTPQHPTMALDGTEIRLPFLGEDEEPAGNLVGFVGRQVV
jgi:hypothetical protein